MLTTNDLGALHLDPDFIEDDLQMNFNFAWQAQEFGLTELDVDLPSEEEDVHELPLKRAVAASHYRQAAAHSLLIYDPSRREDLFNDAAFAYASMNLPYAFNMAVFTDESYPIRLDRHILSTGNAVDDEDFSPLQTVEVQAQYVYMLLADLDPKFYRKVSETVPFEKVIQLRRNLEEYRRVPVGIFGIPVSNFLDLADAINPKLSEREVSLEAALFPFIAQYDEAIKQTMEDGFHWEQLAFDLHPAEPDLFGVLVRVLSALKQSEEQERVFRFIGNLPLSKPTQILLQGILRDYR